MRKLVLGVGLLVSGGVVIALGLMHRVPAKDKIAFGGARTATPLHSSSAIGAEKAALSEAQSSPNIAVQYSRLPLAFEPNRGQMNNKAKFLARGDGYSVFLTPLESIVVLKSVSSGSTLGQGKTGAGNFSASLTPISAQSQTHTGERTPAVLRMELVGANRGAHLTVVDKLPGKSNYLSGNRPSNWHVNIPNYQKVLERGIYRGVDLDYYGTQRQLEYDFVVGPGADTSVIQLAFRGAEHTRIDSEGDLVITVAGSNVRLHKPVAYQVVDDHKEMVAANYVLSGKQNVAFKLGNYDPSRQLVIDPILSYSTYLGGSNIDGANAIAVAPDKTAFIAGGTFSIDFPTAHPLQPNHGGPDDFSRDAFVSKLSADGSTLLYSTYLGGKNEDVANGIAVDSFGDAYVTGTTLSPDFPVTPDSFNPSCGGDDQCGASFNQGGGIVSNAFVTKLNPEGSGLVYSGYLGEYEHVRGQAIAVDANQVAYVTGATEANFVPTKNTNPGPPPFPITPNAAQPFFGGGTTDAFLTQISATGRTILYSTYVGGSNEDSGLGVAADGTGNAYVTGLSYSVDFPVTGSAFQGANGGAGDAFLVKINTAGGPFIYSTLLGGSGLDEGNAVAVDAAGNAFITGETGGSIAGVASRRPYGGGGDAFVAKFNPSTSGVASLIYFTYLGGSLADAGQGIAVDSNGNAYVTGSTVSTDFPGTSAVFQPKYGGGNADAFVTKLDPAGATLLYSSYLGGTNTDIGYGIAVDTDGSAYVAGQTCSLDFPLANPEEATPGGNCDAFVSKVSILNGLQLNPAGLVFNGQSLGTTSQPQVVTVTNGDATQTISITGPASRDFAETGTSCKSSLQPGEQCTISVTFTPQAPGIRKDQINVQCSTCGTSGTTYVLNLTGQSSTLTLSASSLFFGNQQVGAASNAISVTATNSGSTAITFTSVTASGDFAETDDCVKAPLQPGTNCAINVTFTPSSAGSSVGALTLTDNAPGSPQIVLLTGTGFVQHADFTMSVAQPFASIPAGQSTNFSLLVGAVGGFSQPVTLGCSGLPRNASCVASANQVTPTAPPTPFTVTITTGLRAAVPPSPEFWHGPSKGPWIFALGLTGLLAFLALTIFGGVRVRLATAALGLAVILMLGSAGCNSGNQAGLPAGTPAGSYQITVTGTSGAISHSATLNLQVN